MDSDSRTGLLLVAAISSALAGCTTPTGEGGATGPLALTLELDRTQLAPGEWVNVTITVENTGSSDYTYQHPGCPPELFRANVVGEGQEIRLYSYGDEPLFGACAIRPATIRAGETMSARYQWNGRSTPQQPEPHRGGAVAPAMYTVRVDLARADDGPRFTAEEEIRVLAS